jgi:hypothetical protein
MDTTLSADGVQVIVARAYDLAGNRATARVTINVRNRHDDSPPRISLTAQRDSLWPPNGKLVPVTFTGTVADDASVIREVSFSVHDEYGHLQPSGTAVVRDGRFSFTANLQASRLGRDADGRRYVMTVTASDLEGNRASASASVVVQHDRGSAP